MVLNAQKVMLSDMIHCLSRVMEWISPTINSHQMRVAYIARCIAKELGLSREQQNNLTIAGMMHDIGAFTVKVRSHLDNYNTYHDNVKIFSELSYHLLKECKPFYDVAELIRTHHVYWKNGKGCSAHNVNVSKLCQIISLAEMIDIFIQGNEEILGQVPEILQKIQKSAKVVFIPEYTDAFTKVAEREFFWFNIESVSLNDTVTESLRHINIELDIDDMLDLSKIFGHLIDFQHDFTATHSSSVAGTAEALARLHGFSENACRKIKVACHFHDIGKLTIAQDILNKPAKLTSKEYNIVKKHPFWTYRALNNIKGLEEINSWASFHHERINSSGYPFRCKGTELPLESRIIAVADVFSALTEDRPYRKRLESGKVQDTMREMVTTRYLDGGVTTMLMDNYHNINETRINEQADSARLYKRFYNATIRFR